MLTVASFIRCIVSVTGVVFVWCGGWVLFRDYLPAFSKANLVYFFAGIFGLLISKTFLLNCNMNVPVTFTLRERDSVSFRLWHFTRHILGNISIVLVWVSVYWTLDLVAIEMLSPGWHTFVGLIYLVVGLLIRVLTDTIAPSILERNRPVILFDTLGPKSRAWVVFRGMLGIFGSVISWVGVDHLIVNYEDEEQYVGPKILSIGLGIFVMAITYSLPDHANVTDISWDKVKHGTGRNEDIPLVNLSTVSDNCPQYKTEDYSVPTGRCFTWLSGQRHEWILYLNRMMGQFGYYLFWSGIQSYLWFFTPQTRTMYVFYLLSGFLLQWLTRTLTPGTSTLGERSVFAACLPATHTPQFCSD